MTHNERRDWIGRAMEEKGFNDPDEGFTEGALVKASFVFTEIVEAMQEVKRYWGKAGVDQSVVKQRVAEECADTAVRLYHLSAVAALNLDQDCTLDTPADVGTNNRNRLIIRCGRVCQIVGELFTVFDDVNDQWDGVDQNDAVVFCLMALNHLDAICRLVGHTLPAEIEKKMAVNMARPHRYGTPLEAKA